DITIVSIALPSAQDELGFDIASRQWVITFIRWRSAACCCSAATSGVATRDAGVASAMVNTSQQIGGTVGTAALSTIFTTALACYIDDHQPPTRAVAAAGAIHGYSIAFHIAAALFLAGAILTAPILRSGRRRMTRFMSERASSNHEFPQSLRDWGGTSTVETQSGNVPTLCRFANVRAESLDCVFDSPHVA
ncbi:MAG: hypothetical protein ACXWD8_16050, partial [Mycobacterium sp.]